MIVQDLSNHFRPCPKPDRKLPAAPKPIKQVSEARKKRIANGDGEYALFEALAAVRPHVCFVTRRKVSVRKASGELDIRCFAHVVSKGARPDLRTKPENIVIVTPLVHTIHDRGNANERKQMEKYEGWHKLKALHDKIQEENQ